MDDEIAEKLLAFLAERLGPSDLDRAEGILQGRDDGPTGMAADSLRRRVAAGVTRRQAARGGSFEAMFPHANRLA
ncbi:hypothetical protein [Lichenicoccus roseus]|uniref:Uncharacterized protein n=1 Tax=Lichenicoccus roseus TaxID=2683649 RepID=A0A5R9J442_9PROT|nr:hypothetical protein [Lichenicoccus roseus]TLU71267.1 hypothetical protein FE263_17330 [Lichenicoccus roseus]